jgi:hypothetical protein
MTPADGEAPVRPGEDEKLATLTVGDLDDLVGLAYGSLSIGDLTPSDHERLARIKQARHEAVSG